MVGVTVSRPQIEPRILKGFQDILPDMAMLREHMIYQLSQVFQGYGFAPIDTPALEYSDILLGKGSAETDRQTYRFLDQGGRDVALRFDLTVPLARFVAMHIDELGAPFRRYHMGPVWRAEKPQRGRFREFIQCDFDIIGSDAGIADAEVLAVAHAAFQRIGIEHTFRVNNRKILNGLLEHVNAADRSVAVLRAIDKIDKLGADAVRSELFDQAQLNAEQVAAVFRYLDISRAKLAHSATFTELLPLIGGSEVGQLGISELRQVIESAEALGVKIADIELDLTIARGLDYYTGTIFETRMTAMPEIGSIASGGRYDNLASLFTSRRLPGVGGSIGLDRLLAACEELGLIDRKSSPAEVFVTLVDANSASHALTLARQLRADGIRVETSLEVGGLGGQIKYAVRKGIPFVAIYGETEHAAGSCALKNLTTGEQVLVPVARLVETLRQA